MSARTPFFSNGANSRPPTRNTTRTSSDLTATSVNPGAGFQPDLSNPLHAFGQTAAKTVDAEKVSTGVAEPVKLNTSGLGGVKKRRATAAGTAGLSGAQNIGNNANQGSATLSDRLDALSVPRPPTADPHAKPKIATVSSNAPAKPRLSGSPYNPPVPAYGVGNGRQGDNSGTNAANLRGKLSGFARRENSQGPLMAPVPLRASVPLLTNASLANFDMSNSSFSDFKTPALNGQQGQSGSSDAQHTSGGTVQIGRNRERQEQPQQQPQTFRSFKARLSLTSDTSAETLIGPEDESFNTSISKNNHGGARRILVDDNGKPISGAGVQFSDEQDRSFQQAGAGAVTQHAGTKRSRVEAEMCFQDGNSYEESGIVGSKMRKLGNDRRMSREVSYASPMHHPQRTNDGRGNIQQNFATSSQQLLEDEPSQGAEDPSLPVQPARKLDELLKMDTDEFINEHMELYQQNLLKWTSCTLEEWARGPEALSARFSEILDLVKDRMMSHLSFCSDLGAKLDDQDEILRARQQSLDLAKERALGESRNVLQ